MKNSKYQANFCFGKYVPAGHQIILPNSEIGNIK